MKGNIEIKTYLKHFLLAFNMLQWIFVWLVFMKLNDPASLSAAIIFACMGLTLYLFFIIITDKLKQVNFSETSITIPEAVTNNTVSVSGIKSINLLPLIPVYKIDLKQRKKSVYTIALKSNIDIVQQLKDQIKLDAPVVKKERKVTTHPIPAYDQISI